MPATQTITHNNRLKSHNWLNALSSQYLIVSGVVVLLCLLMTDLADWFGLLLDEIWLERETASFLAYRANLVLNEGSDFLIHELSAW